MTADRVTAQDAEETACTCGEFAGTSVRYADCPVHNPQPAQPVDVAAVLDGDREKAARIYYGLSSIEEATIRPAIERALAEERQRAVASATEPFEKLAAELDDEARSFRMQGVSYEQAGWHDTGQLWHDNARKRKSHADRIRAVLAEVRAGSGEATRG